MADEAGATPKAATNWADVGQTAMHYAAGGALFAAIGYFAYLGKIPADTFVNLCIAGLASLGVYHTTK